MRTLAADAPDARVVQIITAALVIQTAHMVEHVAQVSQKFVLMMDQARGFLGAIFDLEWVHFVYNAGLEVAFLAAFLRWRRADRTGVSSFLTVLVWVQGYHTVEHIAKMVQYYALGITMGPKGLLGFVLPLIWLHFAFNLVVLTLVVLVWDHLRGNRFQPSRALA